MRSRTRLVVPVKRPNKAVMALGDRVWTVAEGMEGRGRGRRKSGLRRMFRTQHRIQHVTEAGRERIEVAGVYASIRDHVRPSAGARCGKAARRDLCGGRRVIAVPTATLIRRELKEAVLGHAVDSEVVEAYQRSDRFKKRRSLMDEWEKFLLQPPT
jgi:hypothetical protein